MKFVVSSASLLNLLQHTGRVVSTKNTLPILDYFLFSLSGEHLSVTASDLETTLISTLKVERVDEEGIIAVPAKMITDTLKEFSDQPLTISVNKSTWEITVSWKTGKLSIPGVIGTGYPAIPTLSEEGKQSLEIPAQDLLDGISKTIFATADSELRPVMNGIYFDIAPDSITFVATDAHKLVKFTFGNRDNKLQNAFILPKKPAVLLRNMLGKETETITVEFDDHNAIFRLSNFLMICRLIEGKYPNYNSVIPANNPNKVIVDRTELLNCIKRVSVCSNQASNLIKLEISKGSILLSAQDTDFSVSAEDTLPCNYEGEHFEIGFKSTFLMEILSNIETQEVSIELADSTRAALFFPSGEQKGDVSMLMLLMPMMINA